MTPSAGAGASPLPPLPDLGSAGGTGAAGPGGPPGLMSALVSGIAPVKMGVDGILQACKSIVQSGAVPGAEQICGQIVALATSLLPMAAQSALQPAGGAGGGIPAVAPGGPPPGPNAGAPPPMGA
jgi:hypothetical protein